MVLMAAIATLVILTLVQNSAIIVGIAGMLLAIAAVLFWRKPTVKASVEIPAKQLSLTMRRKPVSGNAEHWYWESPQNYPNKRK